MAYLPQIHLQEFESVTDGDYDWCNAKCRMEGGDNNIQHRVDNH
ncbi:hypothetical protein [Citrobacter freundii]